MKNQNKKEGLFYKIGNTLNNRITKFVGIGIWIAIFTYVFAADISYLIPTQNATWFGSNNSQIGVSVVLGGTIDGGTYYIEKWWNSSAIWNYLTGYYFDSGMWFFLLNWSSNPSKNVSFIWSTSKCPNSYGYQLWWYAYNPYFGFMQFDYSSDIFVYYCEGDKKLHGFGYNPYVGFQNFEWIQFEIFPWSGWLLGTTNSDLFVNDTSNINIDSSYTWSDSNYSKDWIGWETFNIDDTKESVIYIIH